MTSSPKIYRKEEDFTRGSTIARKKKIVRDISLDNLSWVPENRTKILNEFKERVLIGKVWYLLVHYDYLCAHYTGKLSKNECFSIRRKIIENYAKKNPNSVINEALAEFDSKNPNPDFEVKETYMDWVYLSYRAISEAFFPIYELIFDLRKGDEAPPYNPSEVISALMGYSSTVDWTGLQAGGVWVEILHSIYESLPRNYYPNRVEISVSDALNDFVAFKNLVNRRRFLSAAQKFASVQSLGPYIGDPATFADRLSKSLTQGVPL